MVYQVYNPTNTPINMVIDGEEVKVGAKEYAYASLELGNKMTSLLPMLEYTEVEVQPKPQPVKTEKPKAEEPASKKATKPVKKSKR